MITFAKRAGVVALTVAVLWAVPTAPVHAQKGTLSRSNYYPYNTSGYTFPGLPANVYNPNLNLLPHPRNYGGYGGYGGFGGFGGYYGGGFAGTGVNLSLYSPGFGPNNIGAYSITPGGGLSLNSPGFGPNNIGAYSLSLGGNGYYPGYVNPFASSYNNTTYSSSPSYGGGGVPYSYPGGYGGYGYYLDPYTTYLFGTADIMRAYGQLGLTSEQARILREVATQAKFETKKKEIDTIAYVRANTPSFTDIQKKIARSELDRIQNIATPSEIWSGKAQNILLVDLVQKSLTKPLKLHPLPLNDKLMAHVNVTAKGGHGNIGLLRNDGRFEWPLALRDIATEKEQKEISDDAREAYRRAATNLKFADLVGDLSSRVDSLRERLLKRANDLPTDQYLAAKRFLNFFDDALAAIKNEDVRRNQDFHKEFSGEGKTIQDLVDYMGKNGLRFAPAVTGDEDAYQALQALFAAYSLAASSNYNPAAQPAQHVSKDY